MQKRQTLFLSAALSISLLLASGCSVFPIKAEIKDEHFRFENFQRTSNTQLEEVYLACYKNRPTNWAAPKQYKSGQHELWVKAAVVDNLAIPTDTNYSVRESYFKFDVQLEPGISYMLNREIEGDNISVWIQEVDSGKRISSVSTDKLDSPLLYDIGTRKQQCASGTV